jgi:hypothetical protein
MTHYKGNSTLNQDATAHKDKPSERPTEDDLARKNLGPQGVPGKRDQRSMTEKAAEQTPEGEFDGHTA